MITSKFGAIFVEDENGEFELYDVMLVDYNIDDDTFVIQTGKARDLDGNLFNLITTDPDTFFDAPGEVDFKEYDEDKDHIILFENEYIDNVTNYFNFGDEIDTFTFLANELGGIKIHRNNDGSFYTKQCENYISFNREEIDKNMFSDENVSHHEYDNDIPMKEFDNPIDAIKHVLSSVLGANVEDMNIIPIGSVNLKNIPIPEKSEDYVKIPADPSKDLLLDLKQKILAEKAKERATKKIDTKKIINETAKKIVGQESVIKTLVNQIYNNQMIINELEKEDELDITELESRKTSILLDGETGTGKTAIIKDICKQLGLPVVVASSTSFTATGYVGSSITDILEDLYNQANGDLSLAERGIIVFDEVDKLAFKRDSVVGKDLREEVQHELLTFIGGGEFEITIPDFPFGQKIKFNTSKNTFILSGAFTDLREDKIKEVDKNHKPMGYSSISYDDYEKEYEVTPDDYIEHGFMREFFGRIRVLASTKSYNEEDCKKILLESSISPLLNLDKTVKMYGYPGIVYYDEFLKRVIEEGMRMKTGARGLQTVMSGIQNNMLDGLINEEFDKEKPIELTTAMVDDYKKLFIRKY